MTPDSPAERMQRVREGARRDAARTAAAAICDLEFSPRARSGLSEDLEHSQLSLSDLEELGRLVVDHARPPTSEAETEPAMTIAPATLPRGIPQPPNLWKYNVRADHLEACVAHSLFAESTRHNLSRGDVLLLQVRKADTPRSQKRIAFAMTFDHYQEDTSGVSRELWGRDFAHLIHGRMHRLVHPFSLEDLDLSKSYSVKGKIPPERIADPDRKPVLEALGPLL